jgi:hypothetical protein
MIALILLILSFNIKVKDHLTLILKDKVKRIKAIIWWLNIENKVLFDIKIKVLEVRDLQRSFNRLILNDLYDLLIFNIKR